MVRYRPNNQVAFRLTNSPSFLAGELIIDSFAGAGGVSLAMEHVFGRSPDIAINHNKIALETHKLNHPSSLHIRDNIWKVDPIKVTHGRPVGLFWASPDCTHFSKAKGGKPVKGRRRGLANVVVKWAKDVRPRVIGIENVEEFMTWGPVMILRDANGDPILDKEGKWQWIPNKARGGEYFRSWVASLESLGYTVEWRILNAADFGAPTTRERFFMIARRDGRPIQWPEPTHGEGRAEPWVPAANIIDYSLECPSIFDRKRPLADATLRRIAMGIVRYVIEDPQRFIIKYHGNKRGEFRGQDLSQPLRAVDTSNRFGLVAPTIMTNNTGTRGRKLTEPLPTQTTTPHHYQAYCLLKHYTGVVGQSLRKPTGTVTTVDHHSLEAIHLTKFRGSSKAGASARKGVPTLTASGTHIGLVSAFLVKYYGTAIGAHLRHPVDTITSKPRFALVIVNIDGEEYYISDIGMRMLQPHELAAAHDFPPGYFLIGTKEQQVAMIGNSVPWKPAAALLRSNFLEDANAYEEAVA